jgi:hypothetical protein
MTRSSRRTVPITLTIGGVDNASTDEGGYDRPNYIGGPMNASNQTTAGWFNRSAFAEAPAGQFGNVGRNTAVAPGIFDIDAELHKAFVMPYNEHHQLQLRFEAFNVLNHPNWGEPTANILSGAAIAGAPTGAAHAGFGTISGTATSMRQLQLGLKYTF